MRQNLNVLDKQLAMIVTINFMMKTQKKQK